MGNSIKPQIENSRKTGVCQISKKGLDQFPNELLQIQNQLRTLDISSNKLRVLPGAIGNFSNLKNLAIDNNRLTVLPGEISNLKKLDTLSAGGNALSTLPRTFGKLSNLKNIDLSRNLLTEFPMELCDIRNLDVVNLSHNKITTVPQGIERLTAIELNLNQNRVNDLSESIVSAPRLKVLRLEENCLPISAFTPDILKNSTISLFVVEGNVFSMKEFHELNGYDEYMSRFTATKKKFN